MTNGYSGSPFSGEAMLKDRNPCAFSGLISKEGKQVGRAEIYATPLGTVIRAAFFSLQSAEENYDAFSLEIDGRRDASDSPASYRAKTSFLPPVFIRKGKGSFSYTTELFSASELIGRRMLLKKGDSLIAEGSILKNII